MSMPTLCRLLSATALLAALVVAVPGALADTIQSTASLPPDGRYTTPTVCIHIGPGVCVVNAALFGFTGTTSVINGLGQAIDSNVTFTALVYTDNNGQLGNFLGPLTLGGPIGILYSGRTSDSELGTFTSTLTELDLTGMFNGHSIEMMLSATPSMGPTTVAADGNEFRVSSFFDVFVELSIDHGAFVQGPERTFTLMPTPEPGSLQLMALGVSGLAIGEIRRRVRAMFLG